MNKSSFSILFGTVLYLLIAMATSVPDKLDPCQTEINSWLAKDTNLYKAIRFQGRFNGDSCVFGVDTTYNFQWNNVADSICGIYKNRCNLSRQTLIFINIRDTMGPIGPFGTRGIILTKSCP